MQNASFQTIGPAQVRAYLQRGDVQIVDLRDPEEYAERHLKGACSIPYEQFSDRISELDKNRLIFLYCTHGSLSILAAKLLADQGYRTATLAGGMYALQTHRT